MCVYFPVTKCLLPGIVWGLRHKSILVIITTFTNATTQRDFSLFPTDYCHTVTLVKGHTLRDEIIAFYSLVTIDKKLLARKTKQQC